MQADAGYQRPRDESIERLRQQVRMDGSALKRREGRPISSTYTEQRKAETASFSSRVVATPTSNAIRT